MNEQETEAGGLVESDTEDKVESSSFNETDESKPKSTEVAVEAHGKQTSPPQPLVNPIELFRKLEIIKEIKNKTLYLQRIKAKLSQEVDCIENETKSLASFKSELELLIQEEKAHMEELRQIQIDIETMENTIKQTDNEKLRALDSAKRLHYEYKPLKDQINHLRDSIGLDKTDDNEDEALIESFLKKITHSNSADKPKSNTSHHVGRSSEKVKSNTENSGKHKKPAVNQPTVSSDTQKETVDLIKTEPTPAASQQHIDLPIQLATAALMSHSLRALSPNHRQQQQQQQFQQHFNPFILNQVNINNEKFNNLNNEQQQQQQKQQQQQQQQQLQSLPPPFRQQPPPMKSCLSCNQQIHRNAPICPLCKAKSRSRNPKKPKKKSNDASPTNSLIVSKSSCA